MNRRKTFLCFTLLILTGCLGDKEEEARNIFAKVAEAYFTAKSESVFDDDIFNRLNLASIDLALLLEKYQETEIVDDFINDEGAHGFTYDDFQEVLINWRFLNYFEGSSVTSVSGIDIDTMKLTNKCVECTIDDKASANAVAMITGSELVNPKFFKLNAENVDFGAVSVYGGGVGAFFPLNFSGTYSSSDMEAQARYVPEFTFSNFSGAFLNEANLDNVVFFETLLINASFIDAKFRDVAFIRVDGTGAQFSSSVFDDEFSQEPISNKNVPYSEARMNGYKIYYHWGGRALIYESVFTDSTFRNVNGGQGFKKKMGRDFGLSVIKSDLNSANFSGEPTTGDCRHDILSVQSNFESVSFSGCDVVLSADHTSFDRSTFGGSDVNFLAASGHISARGCDFSGSTVRFTQSFDEDSTYFDFRNSNFSFARIEFEKLNISRNVDFSGANFHGVSARYVEFDGAVLKGTNFTDTHLDYASFVDADLTGANFSGASLVNADLSGADLSLAILHGVDLQGAIVKGTNFCGAIGPDGEKMKTGCKIP